MTRTFLVAYLAAFGPLTFGAVGRADEPEMAALKIGDPAPDFELPGVDGRTYRLRDFADAPILMVIFTCNHCPTAQAFEERIKRMHSDYRSKGVALVTI